MPRPELRHYYKTNRGTKISPKKKVISATKRDFDAELKNYWEDPSTVSIIDKNLHQLEIETVCRHLLPTDYVGDFGCGNGEATVCYARKVRKCVGIERSSQLRRKAEQAVKRSGLSNLVIRAGDIMDQSSQIPVEFDVIVTQRLLINLASWEDQMQAVRNIHRMLKPGGRFVMIENTNDAFAALNDVRSLVELPPVPQHWHNRFFDYDQLMAFFQDKFQVLRHYDFGFYYLLTRCFTPMFASFVGYGANAVKDPIFEKADAAARVLFEKFSHRITIQGCRALGPIQVFVLRKEGLGAI
jgi:SAM-dependent methyltransferase